MKDEPPSEPKATRPPPTSASDNGINIPPDLSGSSASDTEAQDLLRSLTVLNLVAPHLDRVLQASVSLYCDCCDNDADNYLW